MSCYIFVEKNTVFVSFLKINWSDGGAVSSIIFLTVISGWLAAVIVDYMYKEVGECSLVCNIKNKINIYLTNYFRICNLPVILKTSISDTIK